MSKFKSLVDSSVKQAEAEVSKYWNEVNILEKTLEKVKMIQVSYFMKDLQLQTEILEYTML